MGRRPRWLLFLLFLLVAYHIGAAIRALQLPTDTAERLSLSPSLLLMTGVTWALLFGWVTIGLVRKKRGSVKRSLMLIAVFIIYRALRLVVFTQSVYDRQRLPFSLMIFLLLLIGVVLTLIRNRDIQNNGE
jgi:uncharacterized membrane protein